MTTPQSTLHQRYEALRTAQPKLRIRDAAKQLSCTELELALLNPRTVQLRNDVQGFLSRAPSLGRVMMLTRNDTAIHEVRGTWAAPSFHGSLGLVLGPNIDLRLYLRHWIHILHTFVPRGTGELRSFQIFDANGVAVQKFYPIEGTDEAAWDALLADMTDQSAAPVTVTVKSAPAPTPAIDIDLLRSQWAALRDSHDVYGLLRKHGISRAQALANLGAPWAHLVSPVSTLEHVLLSAQATSLPIMIFVASAGCVQIFTGPIHHIAIQGKWLNILDEAFNLHTDLSTLHSGWVVKKPSSDGDLHSLELFDAQGELVLQLYGARKPGSPELAGWTSLMQQQLG